MVFRATSFFAVFRLRFPPFLAASFGDTQTPLTLGGKEGTWDFQGGAAPPALTPIEETPAEPPVAQTPPVTPPSDAGPSTSGSWTWSERGEGALLERSSPHPENVLHRGAAQR